MAAQAALIAETIAGMKKAIGGNQYSSDSDDSFQPLTNRGNKLKRKAQYVQNGQLDIPNGPKTYKRKIEHAGYERYIISRNPRRYDEDGDELDDDETDDQADADAAARNPYNGIRIEEILAPLTSAADLPNHPSLSVPYRSSILTNMVQQACEMLHRERRTLSSVKHLLTKLRGDTTWIPCGDLCSEIDDVMFDTKSMFEEASKLGIQPDFSNPVEQKPSSGETLRIDNQNISESETDFQATTNHISTAGEISDAVSQIIIDKIPDVHLIDPTHKATSAHAPENLRTDEADVEMVNISDEGIHGDKKTAPLDLTATKVMDKDENAPEHVSPILDTDPGSSITASASLNTDLANNKPEIMSSPENKLHADATESEALAKDENRPPIGGTDASVNICVDKNEDATSREEDDALLPGPHRMRTRAQAQAASEKTASSRTRSISPASWIPPAIHPIFLMPESARPDRDMGLPAGEAEEIRRMVMLYVQKQEEVCRGAERLYIGLLKADRLRTNVFKWCKAEGHVGEMSDGEDWYDKEEWGLEEDLRKGHDDEEDDAATQVKKTRGRRT